MKISRLFFGKNYISQHFNFVVQAKLRDEIILRKIDVYNKFISKYYFVIT